MMSFVYASVQHRVLCGRRGRRKFVNPLHVSMLSDASINPGCKFVSLSSTVPQFALYTAGFVVLASDTNLALNKPAYQSTTYVQGTCCVPQKATGKANLSQTGWKGRPFTNFTFPPQMLHHQGQQIFFVVVLSGLHEPRPWWKSLPDSVAWSWPCSLLSRTTWISTELWCPVMKVAIVH